MTMIKEVGSKDFPIWLLGDSNPRNWAEKLLTPLDARHPAVHNIWTPILDVIQDKVYRQARLRVDTSDLYIRNAIEYPADKPQGSQKVWTEPVMNKLLELQTLLQQHHPVFLFCFGAFSYEFGRQAMGEDPQYNYNYWGAKRLGADFQKRIDHFQPRSTNIYPLLHASIARRKFIESHNYFCGFDGANYFDFVGTRIAEVLLRYKDNLDIWI
jgi:hypothetical protein